MKAITSIYRAMLLGLAMTTAGAALADHSEMNPNVIEVQPVPDQIVPAPSICAARTTRTI